MKYDFNNIVNRKNTKSIKWDLADESVLPMWVADMDFEVPDAVREAIINRAEHAVYGYTKIDNGYFESIINWWKRRYNYLLKKEWIRYSPGVVPAIHMLIRALTEPGDKVVIQTPVYHPFFSAIKNNSCELVENPLKFENGRYTMDLLDLQSRLKDPKVKVMILCSPHNPVGRVWTKDELTRLGELCIENNVIVIADEIHCDLVYKEYVHIPFTSISEEFAENAILCNAPSKTFNIAGIQASSVVIKNDTLRRKFDQMLQSIGGLSPNIFAIEATVAAYNHGEQWLDELLDYLKGNLDLLTEFISENIPQMKVIKPEGTYLVWVDCRELGLSAGELNSFFLKEAKVWFNEGKIFGSGGDGFMRINIACPRSIIEEGLWRIYKSYNTLHENNF
ncbi:MalY/PatB family protein [Clostridium thermarum]|uniref:MalY/PatB family protein n=1 Tax=Clostridium thermarum TaxID=1716543 RepID=UPI0013CFE4FD|nr:MalY/PatB family protein [Clostridium thermarum]